MRLWNQTRVMAMDRRGGAVQLANWAAQRISTMPPANLKKANARHGNKKPNGQIQAEKRDDAKAAKKRC